MRPVEARAEDAILGIGPYDADEDLLSAASRTRTGHVRVSRPRRTMVVLGRSGDPRRELLFENCREDGVPILRRRGGGGAVVLDPGNVLVAVAWPLPGLAGIRSAFDAITGWIIDALARIGVPGVERRGTSDLALGERKIGGSCIYRRRDLLYFAGTLLVAPRVELMERYLAHPPREPAYRAGRPHRAFVLALAEAGLPADPGQVRDRLARLLTPGSLAERLARSGSEEAEP
ncbi:MAG: hypothetical protein D6718_10170 [Acidobacteria bacterium]|nr:MAG: hypothetical protein D6718_10170 [Acidobacteriota bacterium]